MIRQTKRTFHEVRFFVRFFVRFAALLSRYDESNFPAPEEPAFMPARDQELLEDVYAAFNAREIDTVLARMHPDVVWPNGMEGGVVHGREGVRAYWTRQWAMIDPHVEPRGFRPDEAGRTIVTVRQFVRDLYGAVLVDQMIEHIYTIENSLIRTMEIREMK
jgi:hypothetical protein